jgi:DNA-binding NtrC family response regulator
VPPLRERREDIAALFYELATGFARRYDRPLPSVDDELLARLRAYPWPGNVRELEELARRSVLTGSVEPPPGTVEQLVPDAAGEVVGLRREALLTLARGESVELKAVRRAVRRDVERSLVGRALTLTRGDRRAAARYLGISAKALRYKVRELGLDAPPGSGFPDDGEKRFPHRGA